MGCVLERVHGQGETSRTSAQTKGPPMTPRTPIGHPYLECLDPPGGGHRRWQCKRCDQVGTLAELKANPCNGTATDDDVIAAIEGPREKRR